MALDVVDAAALRDGLEMWVICGASWLSPVASFLDVSEPSPLPEREFGKPGYQVKHYWNNKHMRDFT
jgi:hypothetical protein